MFKKTLISFVLFALASAIAHAAPAAHGPANRLSILKAPTVLAPDAFKNEVKNLDSQNQAQLKKQATDSIAKAAEPTSPPPLPNNGNTNKTKPSAVETIPAPTNNNTPPNSTPAASETTPASEEHSSPSQNFTGFGDDSSSKSDSNSKSSSGLDIQY